MKISLFGTLLAVAVLFIISIIFTLSPDLPKRIFSWNDDCGASSLKTTQDYIDEALEVESKGDIDCSIKLWKMVVDKRPTDSSALANLAIRLSENERHKESIPYHQRAIKLGAGASDVFAWYARSLRQLNHIPEAIEWYYHTLSINPKLSDITAELSELLAIQNSHYEAFNLLEGFEELTGHDSYYSARKTALQASFVQDSDTNESNQSFRIPKLYNNHFYISARLSENKKHKSKSFMIDTGASLLVLNRALLKKNDVKYKTLKKRARAKTADGKRIKVKLVRIPYFKLGPFELKNVKAIVCKTCEPLIGQNILGKFNMSTTRSKGVEFLSLEKR